MLCPRDQETGRRAGGAKDRSNSGLTPKRVSTPKHLSFCEGHVQRLTYQEGTTCGPQGLWLCCHLAAEEQVGGLRILSSSGYQQVSRVSNQKDEEVAGPRPWWVSLIAEARAAAS